MNLRTVLLGFFCVAMLTRCNKTPDLDFSSIQFINESGEVESVVVGDGKKTVIHFFASWCGDCRREMPDANKLLSEAPDDIRVYYFTDDTGTRKAAMEEKYNIPFTTYTLSGSLKDNGVHYIPLNYFIDENGKQVIAQAEKIDWNSTEIKNFLGYN